MNGKLNGAGVKFDKMLSSETLRKDDDALRVLRKHAPDVAQKVEALDATFAALLDKLERIEATHEEHLRARATLIARSDPPNGDEVLQAMGRMTPEMRLALLNKLRQ